MSRILRVRFREPEDWVMIPEKEKKKNKVFGQRIH